MFRFLGVLWGGLGHDFAVRVAGTLPAEAVPEACKKQGATIANLLLKFLSAREAGTLPAEPVPDASKIQGAAIAFFVLCLRKRSLKHVKNRGPLSPMFY